MARIAASLKSTVVAPTKSSLSKFVQQLQTTYQDLSRSFNGGVSYGDGTNTENIDGSWASVTTPTPAGTNFTVTHGLNRIPVGVHVTQKNAFCDVLTVSSTTTTITLQASAAGAAIKLFIFLLLLCLIPVRSDAQGAGHNNIALQTIKLSGNSGYSGNITIPIPGATITVCNGFTLPSPGNTCTGLASIYSCPSLVSCALSNPTNADNNGNYNFFAAGGNNYVVSVGGIGLTTYSYVWSAPFVSGSTVTNAINLVGPGTVTGNYTHSGTETFANINKVVYADQQAGATADVKMANCFVTLPSGGICDATGFGATTQSIAATVTIPTNIWLKCSLSTKFQPSSAINMFNLSPGSQVTGIWVDTSNLSANTFNKNVFGIGVDGQNFFSPYVSSTTLLDNFLITASNQTTVGNGVNLSASSNATNSISFVTVSNGRVLGMDTGYLLVTVGTGYITGNTFDNLSYTVSGTAGNGFVFSSGGTHGIIGNQFSNDSFEGGGATSGAGVLMEGTQPIQDNQFSNLVIWDTVSGAVPFNISNAAAADNWFQGRFDGTVTDGAGGNNFINTNVISSAQFMALNSLPLSLSQTLSLGKPIKNLTGTATMGLTLKTGSGGGNYTNATTSYTVADATNLCYTVTIPTGWKLGISASGGLGTSTAVVESDAALTDNAACSTANAGILIERAVFSNAAGNTDPFALNWVINGDGAAHNIALQFKTTNVADTANLVNSSASKTPTMTFTLMPSN